MDQEPVGELGLSVGYVLKQVHASLRTAMDETLRPLVLTVPQYACMELLGQNPGLSNSELARRAFVTRQSMNLVLRRLQERGLLTRPDQAPHGRALPSKLTKDGQAILRRASAAVRTVEKQLFSPLSQEKQLRLREDLAACVASARTRTRPPRPGRPLHHAPGVETHRHAIPTGFSRCRCSPTCGVGSDTQSHRGVHEVRDGLPSPVIAGGEIGRVHLKHFAVTHVLFYH